MANSGTKNNVSGAPKTTGQYGKGTGGQNTAAFVRGGTSSAYTNGGYTDGLGGAQNGTNGGKGKYPTRTGAEASLENNRDGGAIQGGLGVAKRNKVK